MYNDPLSLSRPRNHPLTAGEVLAKGGWHPRYARVIAVTSDGDYGFALIDGNGDGQELEAEGVSDVPGVDSAGCPEAGQVRPVE